MKFSEALNEYIHLKMMDRTSGGKFPTLATTMTDEQYHRRMYRLEEIMDGYVNKPIQRNPADVLLKSG